jgi:hypothetical protein
VVSLPIAQKVAEQPQLIKPPTLPKTVMAQTISFSSLDNVFQYSEGRHKKQLFGNELFENEKSISPAIDVSSSGSAVYRQ